MTRRLLRVRSSMKTTRKSLQSRVSARKPARTSAQASGGSGAQASGGSGSGFNMATEPVSSGQPVKVKTGFISFMGNHGLEAGQDNASNSLGAWRGTQGVVELVRCDRVLVGLKAGYSNQSSEYWVRRSGFWRIFEPA